MHCAIFPTENRCASYGPLPELIKRIADRINKQISLFGFNLQTGPMAFKEECALIPVAPTKKMEQSNKGVKCR